jgi:hypothetical protein
MAHYGDWIYLHSKLGDQSPHTLFIKEDYAFWNSRSRNSVLRPVDSSNPIFAQYQSGDMNTKNSGFRMFVVF